MKGSEKAFNSTYFQDTKLIEDQQLTPADLNGNPQEPKFSIEDHSQKPSAYQTHNSKMFTILITLLLMMLILSGTFYFKEIITLLAQKLQVLQIQQHSTNSKFTEDKNSYKILDFESKHLPNFDQHLKSICPNISQTFHVDFNTSYQSQSLSVNIRNQIDLCGTPVLTQKDLQELKERWNRMFSDMNILDQNLLTVQIKQNLLAFLTLYFFGGTYININVPYSQLHYRCYNYVLTGFDIIFGDFEQKNQQSIYVPNPHILMKTRFPYSPQVKRMIQKIIRKQDFLEDCRKKQCLVMKCI